MEGCDCWHEITGMDDFTEEEREEIDEDNIDIDFLDDEWTSTDDSSYELCGGCELEKVWVGKSVIERFLFTPLKN